MKRFFYSETDSTNLCARRLVSELNPSMPFWISAAFQTRGKGYGSNTWQSDPDQNLTISLVFQPFGIRAWQQFSISQSLALGVLDFLHLFVEKALVKWPNDIYLHDKKVGGLLIENDIKGEEIERTIAGIGININQESFLESLPNPVSLKTYTGISYKLEELENLLVQCLQSRIERLAPALLDQIKGEYLKSLYRYKHFAPFKTTDQWFEGRIVDVDSFGHLLIEEKNGKSHSFGFKEVEFIL